MFISIVIPLYNKESRISVTLESVLCLDGNFEVIVVDDGSTDKSASIVKAIADSRIKYIYQTNSGPAAARNRGIKESKGDWIVFLDADDEFLPNALGEFMHVYSKYPDVKCFAFNFYQSYNNEKRLFYAHSSCKVINNPHKDWCELSLFPRTGAAFFHKSVVDVFKFDCGLRRYEDAEWLFRIFRKEKFVRSSTPILVYNIDAAAASRKRDNVSEDFMGHLDMRGKCLWEQVAIYQLLKEAFNTYPVEAKRLYADLGISKSRKWLVSGLQCYCRVIQVKNGIKKRLFV